MPDSPGPTLPRRISSLVINVSTLLQEPIGAVREYDLDEAVGDGRQALNGALRLLRTDQSLLVSGRLETTAEDVCGACLMPLAIALRLEFDEEFWPAGEALDGRRTNRFVERDGFAVIDGQIDLTEVVRQYTEMARPMSPRCGSDCPGAASEEAPPEAEQEIDDRWAALGALREQLAGHPNRP